MLGSGALLTWMDVDPPYESEFNKWLTFDHVPERLSVTGFNRARRYISAEPVTAEKYFNFYETTDVDALASTAYLARLAQRSEWTSRIIGHLTAVSRTACTLLHSVGDGVAGMVGCLTFETAGAGELKDVQSALDHLVADHHLLAAHLLRAEPGVTNADNPVREGRVDQTSHQGCVIVAELADPRSQREVAPVIESLGLLTASGSAATMKYFRLLMMSDGD